MKKGLKFTKWNNKFNKEEILNLVKEGKNIKQISEIVKIPARRLADMFKYYNISKENFGQQISKNHHFFENINTEIKAYLLGYTIADGCVIIEPKKKNGKIYSYCKRLHYGSSIDDYEVIELLREYISPESKIKEFHNPKGVKIRKRQLSLRINSSKLVDDLIKLNVIPNKTYHSSFEFPFDKIEFKLIRHFIRGFIDGDGSICKGNINLVSTSKIFLEQILNYFIKEIPEITFRLNEYEGKTINYYKLYLNIGKGIENKIYDYLYKDSNFFLTRKKTKFKIENTVLT